MVKHHIKSHNSQINVTSSPIHKAMGNPAVWSKDHACGSLVMNKHVKSLPFHLILPEKGETEKH